MPPRAVKRATSAVAAAPPKKRPLPPSQEDSSPRRQPSPAAEEARGEKDFALREVDRHERLDLEHNASPVGAGVDEKSAREMERNRKIGGKDEEEGGEERIDGDDIMEEIIEVEEEVVTEEEEEEEEQEVEVSEEDFQEEHIDKEEEHHEAVKERLKRKQLEVFVGGLDPYATEGDLRKVFSKIGEITDVRLIKRPSSEKNKGFAFLRFASVEQARRAVNELKHPVVNGKRCGVAPCQDNDALFIGNICKTWSKEVLKEKLAHYGIDNYDDLILVEDPKNEGMNRGFAFLDFSSREDALKACKCLQKQDVVFGTDRAARVAFAETFIEPDEEIMSHVRTIFIDGLLPTWDENCVKEHLRNFGKIEKVELARNMPAAKRQDFGFVTFDTHDSAVACVEGINNTELGDGNEKVKVRARLCRPRQRGKSLKHRRGVYPVRHGSHWSDKVPFRSSSSQIRSQRLLESRRNILYRSRRGSGLMHPVRSRDTVSLSARTGNVKQFSSPERSYGRRSPAYVKTSFRRGHIQQVESLSRSSDFAKVPVDRYSHKDDAYLRGSRHFESPPRSLPYYVARRQASPHDYSRGRYMEHPTSYHDGHSHQYSSISRSKRPHSAIDDVHRRNVELPSGKTRARLEYGDRSSELAYGGISYGGGSTRPERGSRFGYDEGNHTSSGHSQGIYNARSSTSGYKRDETIRRDVERMYSSYGRDYAARDYISQRSHPRLQSYPTDYPRHRVTDNYLGSRDSGSYY